MRFKLSKFQKFLNKQNSYFHTFSNEYSNANKSLFTRHDCVGMHDEISENFVTAVSHYKWIWMSLEIAIINLWIDSKALLSICSTPISLTVISERISVSTWKPRLEWVGAKFPHIIFNIFLMIKSGLLINDGNHGLQFHKVFLYFEIKTMRWYSKFHLF